MKSKKFESLKPKDKKSNKDGKINPFEVHINRSKHPVLGQKSKDDKGLPGVSRGKAYKKREKTLLHEYKNRYKDNKFVDKRIGEKNKFIDPEKKMMMRMVAEKMKQYSKRSVYNLNDDEELFHAGKRLDDMAMKDKSGFSDDEDDDDVLDADYVKDKHFGGEIFSKNQTNGEKNAHKTKQEWIEEIIAESKKKKVEAKMDKEFHNETVAKLDEQNHEYLTSLKEYFMTDEDKEKSKKSSSYQDYDRLVRELLFDRSKRAAPTDALKTDEQIAKEERERLQRLEEERQRRMRGETESYRSSQCSADALYDGWGYTAMETPVEDNRKALKKNVNKPITSLKKKGAGAKMAVKEENDDEEMGEEEGEEDSEIDRDQDEEESSDDEAEGTEDESDVEGGEERVDEEEVETEGEEEEDEDENEVTVEDIEESKEEDEESEDDVESAKEEEEESDLEEGDKQGEVVEEDTEEEEIESNEEKDEGIDLEGEERQDEEGSEASATTEVEDDDEDVEEEEEGSDEEEESEDEEEEGSDEEEKTEDVEEEGSDEEEKTEDVEEEGSDEEEESEDEEETKWNVEELEWEEELSEGEGSESGGPDDGASFSSSTSGNRTDEKSMEGSEAAGQEEEEELPYTFEVPSEYDDFWNLLQGKSGTQVSIVLERMIACHHISLSPENKNKCNTIFAYILQTLHDLCSPDAEELKRGSHPFSYIDVFVPHLYNLNLQNPADSASAITQVIDEKYEDYKSKKLKKYPYADTFIFLKVAGLLYPASDYNHDVMTRVLTFLTQLLGEVKANSGRQLVCLLFTASLLYEYMKRSQRFVGELTNALNGVLCASIRKRDCEEKLPRLPPFKERGPSSEILVLYEPVHSYGEPRLKLTLLNQEINLSQNLKIKILNDTLVLLDKLCLLWTNLQSVKEIFAPTAKLLSKLNTANYPRETSELVVKLRGSISYLPSQVSHLRRMDNAVKTIRMIDPVIEEVFEGVKKRGGTTKESHEERKLIHKLKRERKGAKRELKRDAQFIARQQLKETLQSDVERKRKVNLIMQELGMQESEYKKMKLK